MATGDDLGLLASIELLKVQTDRLRLARRVRIDRLRVGRRPRQATLARATELGLPEKLIELCGHMNGFEIQWSLTSARKIGGRADFRSLLRHMRARGEGVALDPELEEAQDSTYVLDAAPTSTRICWIDGDLGLWDAYGCVFNVDGPSVESYLRMGVKNLFVDGWFEHYLESEGESLHPDAIVAREILEMPLESSK